MKNQSKKYTHIAFFALALIGMIVVQGWQSASTNEGGISSDSEQIIKNITPDETHALIQEQSADENFVILDVRTPGEFKSARLENAINLNYYASDFRKELAKLAKDKTYLVYCRTGNRSSRVLQLMQAQGFDRAYNMLGGIMHWYQEELPIQQ